MNTYIRSRGYKILFLFNSVEQENLIAHKYKDIKKFGFYQGQICLECCFSPFINDKMPTIVGIFTFMSRKNFMLSSAEHEKSFITPGSELSMIQTAFDHYFGLRQNLHSTFFYFRILLSVCFYDKHGMIADWFTIHCPIFNHLSWTPD